MANVLNLATAASNITPGTGDDPHSLFTLSQLISEAASNARSNDDAALALSRRIDDIVSIIASESDIDDTSGCAEHAAWNYAVENFAKKLEGVKDSMQTLGKRSYLSRILHREKDKQQLLSMNEAVDRAIDTLKLSARLNTSRLLTPEQPRVDSGILESMHELTTSLRTVLGPQNAAVTSIQLLPKPPLFLGRAVEMQAVVDAMVAEAPGRVAILGGPGFGKTTLALSVLHDSTVVELFGGRRYFIACDAAEGPSGSLDLIASRFGIRGNSSQAVKRALQFALSEGPSLLVLDNFESAWEATASRAEAEDTLQFLSEISTLRLVITMRGAERPQQVHWSRPFLAPLSPLSAQAAAQVFVSVAETSGTDDDLALLLAHLENVPLAIMLMANLAQSESLQTLLTRWDSEKTRMLNSGSGTTRLNSLDMSISLSIGSPRMQQVPATIRLLQMLALLPAGAMEDDMMLWAMYDSHALSTLLQVALATRSPGRRLYVLAPIRSFVLAHIPPSDDDAAILHAHYFDLAATVHRAGKPPSQPEDVSVLVHELSNIEALIQHSMKSSTSLDASLQATAYLCRLHYDTGLGSAHRLLPEALELARLYDRRETVADLLFISSCIHHNTGLVKYAIACSTEAQAIYKALDLNVKYFDAAVMCATFMAPDEGLILVADLLAIADILHDTFRAVKCHGTTAALYKGKGMPAKAIPLYEAALQMHADALLPADGLVPVMKALLGECYFLVGNSSMAAKCWEDAIVVGKQLQLTTLLGFTGLSLGHLYLKQGYCARAIEHFTAASVPLQQWGSRDALLVHALLSEAHLLRDDVEAASAEYHAVRRLQQGMGCGRIWSFICEAALSLHVGDALLANAILSAMRNEWYSNRELLVSDYLFAAQLGTLHGQLAKLEGDDEAAVTAFILGAIAHHRLGTAVDVAINLVELSEVTDNTTSQTLLDVVLLPMVHFGYLIYLARGLLQSARNAQCRGDIRTAKHRAQRALLHYQTVDNAPGCQKASALLSDLTRVVMRLELPPSHPT